MIRKKLIYSIVMISLTISVFIFSLVAFSDVAFSWFTNGNNATSGGVGTKVVDDDILGISYLTVYKVDEGNTSATKHINPAGEYLSDLLTLNKYDSVFEEKRENIPIIIKLEIGPLDVNIEEVIKVRLLLNEEDTSFTQTTENGTFLSTYISNFLQVKMICDDSFDDNMDASLFYKNACLEFLNEESLLVQSSSFVTYSYSGDSLELDAKSNEIEFSITKEIGKTSLNIFLFISYDDALISKFVLDNQKNIGTVSDLEDYFVWGEELTFKKDLKLIKVEKEEE